MQQNKTIAAITAVATKVAPPKSAIATTVATAPKTTTKILLNMLALETTIKADATMQTTTIAASTTKKWR